MAVYQSKLYVLDKVAKEGTSDEILRVQVFNSSGTQTGTINLAETEWLDYHDEFASIAIDSLGNIYTILYITTPMMTRYLFTTRAAVSSINSAIPVMIPVHTSCPTG
jgi:hypothetical protein